jgi:hypothetical protein
MPYYVLIGFLLPDMLLTIFAAIMLRRPGMLLLIGIFPALRFLEAYICLRCIPRAWRTQSSGRWVSPTRLAVQPGRPRTTERATICAA